MNDLKEAHKAQDLDKVETTSTALNAAWQAASQDMYQASQEQGATADSAGAEQTGEGGKSDGFLGDGDDI